MKLLAHATETEAATTEAAAADFTRQLLKQKLIDFLSDGTGLHADKGRFSFCFVFFVFEIFPALFACCVRHVLMPYPHF